MRQIPGLLLDTVYENEQNHCRGTPWLFSVKCLEIDSRTESMAIVISKTLRVKNQPILLKTAEVPLHDSIVADLDRLLVKCWQFVGSTWCSRCIAFTDLLQLSKRWDYFENSKSQTCAWGTGLPHVHTNKERDIYVLTVEVLWKTENQNSTKLFFGWIEDWSCSQTFYDAVKETIVRFICS